MNRLAEESSPYLLQHADNPVDWLPWGPEAFERAANEDRPIFLSIGYSACHWCHVMERESFTDLDTAALLNENFVSVKVDREERPDLDTIYMQAVVALTGHGGWPLSVWLDPQGAPFYGGTYFPPTPLYGRPSFRQVLSVIADIWHNRREELHTEAVRMREYLAQSDLEGKRLPCGQMLAQATAELLDSFDPVRGGWGVAPKFPQPLVLDYLLARQTVDPRPEVETMITTTLDNMAVGGIRDHVGGGFHRYSTDGSWLVPHFEKMLYDNAQLARCYLHAWQATGEPLYREVGEETIDYLLQRLRHPEGGFFGAEDADSEGMEGAFYLWTPAQLSAALGTAKAKLVSEAYGVSAEGNFEGANILHLAAKPQLADPAHASVGPKTRNDALRTAMSKLEAARDQRPRPARDEKIIASWNGLALAALAEAARALHSERYLEAAVETGNFLMDRLLLANGRLAHSWKDGTPSGNGFLDDHASLVDGLLALYQTTFDERWYISALGLAETMVRHFRRDAGGFYDTSDNHETLIARPRSLQDSPTPSGNSLAAAVLLKLSAYSADADFRDLAEATIASAPAHASQAPAMFGQWLSACHLIETGIVETALVGDPADPRTKGLRAVLDGTFRPNLVAAAKTPQAVSALPLLQGKEPGPGAVPTVWVCSEAVCTEPTTEPDELLKRLEAQ